MNRSIFRLLLLFIFVLLEATVLEYLQIFGVKPDLVLILTFYFGIKEGVMSGQITGFVGALMEDLIHLEHFGVNILIKTFLGFLAGTVYHKLYSENFFNIFLTLFSATFIKGILWLTIVYSFLETFSWESILSYILEILLLEMTINGLLAPFIFLSFNKFHISN